MSRSAKELRDDIDTYGLAAIESFNKEDQSSLLLALDLLDAVESSEDEIVRELGEFASVRRVEWSSTNHGADMADKAAARIVSDAEEKERLRAELASVKAERDALRLFGNKDCTAQAEEYLRAARPKDAP